MNHAKTAQSSRTHAMTSGSSGKPSAINSRRKPCPQHRLPQAKDGSRLCAWHSFVQCQREALQIWPPLPWRRCNRLKKAKDAANVRCLGVELTFERPSWCAGERPNMAGPCPSLTGVKRAERLRLDFDSQARRWERDGVFTYCDSARWIFHFPWHMPAARCHSSRKNALTSTKQFSLMVAPDRPCGMPEKMKSLASR